MDGGKYTQVYGADAGGCLRRDRRSNRTPTGAVTFATPPLRHSAATTSICTAACSGYTALTRYTCDERMCSYIDRTSYKLVS